jgi:putative chitinase
MAQVTSNLSAPSPEIGDGSMSTINRRFFFDSVRLTLFDGSLRQKQVDGMTVFLDYWEEKFAPQDDRWLGYMLGTAHHEVGRTMQPINEFGGNAYFFKMYDKDGQRPDVARRLGNTQPGDGVKFHGRGYVQLTGRSNYEKMGNRVDADLVTHPELVLDTKIATKIIFEGMIEGTFTSKKLSDYFNSTTEDWRNARRIVNGLDRADLIASYAKKYYASISYTVA